MKKLLIILLITSFTRNTIAQKANLDGIWKLTETVKYGEQSRTRIAYITFKDNGTIEVSKREIGTWQKNESKNIFSAECFHFPSINGDNIIETLDEKLLKLKNANGEIVSLQKIGLEILLDALRFPNLAHLVVALFLLGFLTGFQ